MLQTMNQHLPTATCIIRRQGPSRDALQETATVRARRCPSRSWQRQLQQSSMVQFLPEMQVTAEGRLTYHWLESNTGDAEEQVWFRNWRNGHHPAETLLNQKVLSDPSSEGYIFFWYRFMFSSNLWSGSGAVRKPTTEQEQSYKTSASGRIWATGHFYTVSIFLCLRPNSNFASKPSLLYLLIVSSAQQ